jgi:hypothetical protein
MNSINGQKDPSRMHSTKFSAKSPKRSPTRTLSDRSKKLLTLESNKATMCEMSVQTDIRGVDHRIIIRPDKFDSDPFEKSDLGKIDDISS